MPGKALILLLVPLLSACAYRDGRFELTVRPGFVIESSGKIVGPVPDGGSCALIMRATPGRIVSQRPIGRSFSETFVPLTPSSTGYYRLEIRCGGYLVARSRPTYQGEAVRFGRVPAVPTGKG
jgi:hypothetical protein